MVLGVLAALVPTAPAAATTGGGIFRDLTFRAYLTGEAPGTGELRGAIAERGGCVRVEGRFVTLHWGTGTLHLQQRQSNGSWQRVRDDQASFTYYSGDTNEVVFDTCGFAIPESGEHRVVFTSQSGVTSFSDPFELRVRAAAPVFAPGPASQRVEVGAAVSFPAAAVAPPGTSDDSARVEQRAQLSWDGGRTWQDTASTALVATPAHDGLRVRYQADRVPTADHPLALPSVVTTSGVAVLTVESRPEVVEHPQTQRVPWSTTTPVRTAEFSAVVRTDGSAGQVVTWQRSTDSGTTWQDVATAGACTEPEGRCTVTHQVPGTPDTEGHQFRVAVTYLAGQAVVHSAAATLELEEPTALRVTADPVDVWVETGGEAVFAADAVNWAGVSWSRQRSGQAWDAVPGGAGSTTLRLTDLTPADSDTRYRAEFRNGAAFASSLSALLVVQDRPEVTRVGDDVLDGLAGAAAQVEADVRLSDPRQSATWERSVDGGATWEPVGAVTGCDAGEECRATHRIEALTPEMTGHRYRVVAHWLRSEVVEGPETRVVVRDLSRPQVTEQPRDAHVLVGQDATFTLAVSGVPEPDVQWFVRPAAGEGETAWQAITGASSTTLTVPAATPDVQGTRYRARASSPAGEVWSDEATLVVETVPVILEQPEDVTVLAGDAAEFTSQYRTDGLTSQQRQWQVSTDGGVTWEQQEDARWCPTTCRARLTVDPAQLTDDGMLVRLTVTYLGGQQTVESRAARLTVLEPRAPLVLRDPQDVPLALLGEHVTLSAAADGLPTPVVRWLASDDAGRTWHEVEGADDPTLVIGPITAEHEGRQYRALFTNREGEALTAPATIAEVRAGRALHLRIAPRVEVVDRPPAASATGSGTRATAPPPR